MIDFQKWLKRVGALALAGLLCTACSEVASNGKTITITQAELQEAIDTAVASAYNEPENHAAAALFEIAKNADTQLPAEGSLDPAALLPPVVGRTGYTIAGDAGDGESYRTLHYAADIMNPNENAVLRAVVHVSAYDINDALLGEQDQYALLYPQETSTINGSMDVTQRVARIAVEPQPLAEGNVKSVSAEYASYQPPIIWGLEYSDGTVTGQIGNPNPYEIGGMIRIAFRDPEGNPLAGAGAAALVPAGETYAFGCAVDAFAGDGEKSADSELKSTPGSIGADNMSATFQLLTGE